MGSGRIWMLVKKEPAILGNARKPIKANVFEILFFVNRTSNPVAAFVDAAMIES